MWFRGDNVLLGVVAGLRQGVVEDVDVSAERSLGGGLENPAIIAQATLAISLNTPCRNGSKLTPSMASWKFAEYTWLPSLI